MTLILADVYTNIHPSPSIFVKGISWPRGGSRLAPGRWGRKKPDCGRGSDTKPIPLPIRYAPPASSHTFTHARATRSKPSCPCPLTASHLPPHTNTSPTSSLPPLSSCPRTPTVPRIHIRITPHELHTGHQTTAAACDQATHSCSSYYARRAMAAAGQR